MIYAETGRRGGECLFGGAEPCREEERGSCSVTAGWTGGTAGRRGSVLIVVTPKLSSIHLSYRMMHNEED